MDIYIPQQIGRIFFFDFAIKFFNYLINILYKSTKKSFRQMETFFSTKNFQFLVLKG